MAAILCSSLSSKQGGGRRLREGQSLCSGRKTSIGGGINDIVLPPLVTRRRARRTWKPCLSCLESVSGQASGDGRVDDLNTNMSAPAPEGSLQEISDAEYTQLKSSLRQSTRTVSIIGSTYAFLALTPATGIAYGWGALFGWVYWGRLVERVDSLDEQKGNDRSQLLLPKALPSLLANPAELGRVSILQAARALNFGLLQPRLLLPTFAIWSCTVWNHSAMAESLDLHLSLPAVWFGFLSYKGAVIFRALGEVRELYFPAVLPLLPEEDRVEDSPSSDGDRY